MNIFDNIKKPPSRRLFLGFVWEEIPYRKMNKPIDTNTALPLPIIKEVKHMNVTIICSFATLLYYTITDNVCQL